jgi:[citrate (pro-3S)-lyase] ligase
MYQIIDCILDEEKKKAYDLVLAHGLFVDAYITQTIMILDHNQMCIATGSIYENVIKMIAIDVKYQGENLTSIILNELILRLNQKGIYKYFIFTTKENKKFFLNLNFKLVIENDDVLLLENNMDTIEDHLVKIKHSLPPMEGSIGTIVMNCNPMTLGHLYLIEEVSKLENHVIIFLVEENKSVFSYEVRERLVKASTKHLNNVYVIPSTKYIISSTTFPTYFLKELSSHSKLHMKLDIMIFNTYFMPIFKINHRYTGTEPYDPLTQLYNQTMKEILKDQWILIDRLQIQNQIVSASFVRKLAKENKYDVLKNYVPEETYQYLISTEGKKLFHT